MPLESGHGFQIRLYFESNGGYIPESQLLDNKYDLQWGSDFESNARFKPKSQQVFPLDDGCHS